jgi:hypothetical protein
MCATKLRSSLTSKFKRGVISLNANSNGTHAVSLSMRPIGPGARGQLSSGMLPALPERGRTLAEPSLLRAALEEL